MDTSKKMALKRMRGYADLKSKKISKDNNSNWKRKDFEVLLGTLKKVETKNAALLIVWVFVGQAVISEDIFGSSYESQLRFLIVVTLLPVLFLSIIGMRQVDQIDFDKYSAVKPSLIPGKLKEDLIKDLIRKEMAFRFNYVMSLNVVGAAMLLVIIFTIFPVT